MVYPTTAPWAQEAAFQKDDSMKPDRRKGVRRPIKISVCCQRVGAADNRLFSASTINVSPTGLLLRMNGSTLRDGDLVSVELSVPPSDGVGQAARFTSYARVVRVETCSDGATMEKQIALEFCETPRFNF